MFSVGPEICINMAPRRREKTTITAPKATATETRRIMTRSIYKKQQMMGSHEKPSKMIESLRLVEDEDEDEDSSTKVEGVEEGCSTPKSEKYKIPEIVTCPPAPKKPRRRRVSVSSSRNCLAQRRRPITFFTHPDLDKFFTFATSDHIKV